MLLRGYPPRPQALIASRTRCHFTTPRPRRPRGPGRRGVSLLIRVLSYRNRSRSNVNPCDRNIVPVAFNASLTRNSSRSLAEALDHFRKGTRSHWPNLFGCYDFADPPWTNNDLDHVFDSYRDHERRPSGRKAALPGTAVRDSVRLVASAASRLRTIEAEDLIPTDRKAWNALRTSPERHMSVRTLGGRCRHEPDAYLKSLEDTIINKT